MILKHCAYIVTQNREREILKDTDLEISGTKIARIGKNLHGEDEVDFSGKILLPGMINTHTHLPMTLLRGYYDNLTLHDWLAKVMAHEAKFTADHVHYGTLLGCLECIKYGTTCVADFYYFPYERAKALEESGLYGFLDSAVHDKPLFYKNVDESIQAAEKFIATYKSNPTVVPIATVHSIYLSSRETLEKVKALSDKYGVMRRIHISETEKEFQHSLSKFKNTPIEFLEKIGWLDEKTLLVHANWITNKEITLVAKRKSKICHNPISNMKLAYGRVMPLKKLLEKGITVGLATDGATSNNNLDLFGDLKVCALSDKFFTNNPFSIPDQKIFDLVNVDGAKVLGIEELTGSLEAGKQADIITIGTDEPQMIPLNKHNSLISHLLYCVSGSDVCDTIVRGRFLMRDKKYMTLDKEKIISRVQRLME